MLNSPQPRVRPAAVRGGGRAPAHDAQLYQPRLAEVGGDEALAQVPHRGPVREGGHGGEPVPEAGRHEAVLAQQDELGGDGVISTEQHREMLHMHLFKISLCIF